MSQPITWRTIQSDVAGVGRTASMALQQGTQDIANSLRGFGQMHTDHVNKVNTGYMADFDNALQGFTNPGDLQAQRAAMMERIGQYGTSPEQQMKMRQALDSRISGLQTQTKNQWEYDNAARNEAARPAVDRFNQLMAERKFGEAGKVLNENAELLGNRSDLYTQLRDANDRSAVAAANQGNTFAGSNDTVYGLSKDEAALHEQFKKDPSSLAPEQVNALEAALLRVQPENTAERRLQRELDNAERTLAHLPPELREQRLNDIRQDFALSSQLPAQAVAQKQQYDTQLQQQLSTHNNIFTQAEKEGGIIDAPSMHKELSAIFGEDFNQKQSTNLSKWLNRITNDGIKITTRGPDGNLIEDTVRVPLTAALKNWVIDNYNSEWFATDANTAKMTDDMAAIFDIGGQLERHNEYKTKLSGYSQSLNQMYGITAMPAAFNDVGALQKLRAAQSVQAAPTEAPTPASADSQPYNRSARLTELAAASANQPLVNNVKESLEQLKPTATTSGRKDRQSTEQREFNRLLKDSEKWTEELDTTFQTTAKHLGVTGEALQNIRAQYLETREVQLPEGMRDSKANRDLVKRRMEELDRKESRGKRIQDRLNAELAKRNSN